MIEIKYFLLKLRDTKSVAHPEGLFITKQSLLLHACSHFLAIDLPAL